MPAQHHHRSGYRVSLPMYDWPEQQASNDRFWRQLREALAESGLIALPSALSRGDTMDEWRHPQTLLSQTCGYPLVHSLKHHVQLVGTPCYDVPLCHDGYYASAVLVRAEAEEELLSDYRQQRIAINSPESQSGCNALRNLFNDKALLVNGRFDSKPLITGSHRESVRAVSENRADICAVDPVSWHLSQRYDADAKSLRVLCATDATPALPLICSHAAAQAYALRHDKNIDALTETLRTSWANIINADKPLARQLMLKGIVFVDRAAYEAVPAINSPM